MALYDNPHWLLSYIRDSFISTDDTGMCETVMVRDDIPKHLLNSGVLSAYPNAEDSDDEDLDALGDSYDLNFDIEFTHRQRTNTAQRLEKMDEEKKKASEIKHIKWENNPNHITLEEQCEFFKFKDLKQTKPIVKIRSLFSEQLETCPDLPQNPFVDYAKFDGSFQIGLAVRKYRIFMCMLPKDQRSYPLIITVLANAKVKECIGFICYKYVIEHPDQHIQEDISKYGLYIAEDDGEVDWDFPCLDPTEVISKFEFSTLGLVEMKPSDKARHNTIKTIAEHKEEDKPLDKSQREFAEDLAKMEGHTTAMEAPLYQLYRVHIINKVRAKTEVHLGISGEKVEIDPVIAGKGASRFWHRQRAVSYHMDNVVWCELVESKGSKSTFTLVYTPHTSVTLDGLNVTISHTQSLRRSASFKNHDFEAESSTAEEIVRKINHILELRSSSIRREYLAQKERKASRRKSFHIYR
ncbi:target of rapamycin complex 2 subunit MAPKAP1 [Phymastichus coffea]|uniref:target of rapamycin complex 2 subunit MAPKAP1 n=1 Tax=Phymastichus coffea TaxID=108790 RepID=UPI00273CE07B|nr:target of rapamycin complex 2 subunit MAPKAP1 [Phymastichus coffea]XP_058803466.1 target of rapamycin complex 2 subunit MAPKAP1 [Phymastichus coffea]